MLGTACFKYTMQSFDSKNRADIWRIAQLLSPIENISVYLAKEGVFYYVYIGFKS